MTVAAPAVRHGVTVEGPGPDDVLQVLDQLAGWCAAEHPDHGDQPCPWSDDVLFLPLATTDRSLPVTTPEFTNLAEERAAVALAMARQQIAHEDGQAPAWEEMVGPDQWAAITDARTWLRALDRAGLREVVAGIGQESSERLERLAAELSQAYSEADRLEHQHGLDQVALRLALRIPPGEKYSMNQLIRRVRQTLAELDDARRTENHLRGGLHEISSLLRGPVAEHNGVVQIAGELRG